jgi:protein-tyrosine phosphatase
VKKTRILFVCLGNICRSPAAEGILKHRVEERGLADSFYIDSAGTGGWHVEELPDARMMLHGARRGYAFTSRARQFSPRTDFAAFDMIIGMDDQNVADLQAMASTDEERAKIHRMIDFCHHFPGHAGIPDPYHAGAAGFELVLDLLEDGVEWLIAYVEQTKL